MVTCSCSRGSLLLCHHVVSSAKQKTCSFRTQDYIIYDCARLHSNAHTSHENNPHRLSLQSLKPRCFVIFSPRPHLPNVNNNNNYISSCSPCLSGRRSASECVKLRTVSASPMRMRCCVSCVRTASTWDSNTYIPGPQKGGGRDGKKKQR